jgi:hypothetical protein
MVNASGKRSLASLQVSRVRGQVDLRDLGQCWPNKASYRGLSCRRLIGSGRGGGSYLLRSLRGLRGKLVESIGLAGGRAAWARCARNCIGLR